MKRTLERGLEELEIVGKEALGPRVVSLEIGRLAEKHGFWARSRRKFNATRQRRCVQRHLPVDVCGIVLPRRGTGGRPGVRRSPSMMGLTRTI